MVDAYLRLHKTYISCLNKGIGLYKTQLLCLNNGIFLLK
jgi:hypothetical protein